jgi:hypothetical protein
MRTNAVCRIAGVKMTVDCDDSRSKAWVGRPHRGCAVAVVVAIALPAASLAGCGSISEDTAAKAAFASGRYDLYTCRDLEERTVQVRKRQLELEQLTARAAQSPGGAIMGAMAYRSEYIQGRGELMELDRQATEKQCAIDSKFTSGRAVF